jgi:hypothetical protein
MHDGPDPTAIQHSDAWLRAEMPRILNSAAYKKRKTVVFITFDEGEGGPMFSIGEDCATNTTDESCHVATIVVSPSTRPGSTSTVLFNHYSLLRTTEQLLRVRPRLGLARHARSMRRPFRL